MDEQTRFNLLKSINEASVEAGRPINATELLKVYAATTGQTIDESQTTRMVKELLLLGDVKAEAFRDSEGVERVQRIEITGNGRKFTYEVQNRPRPFLTENKRWLIGIAVTILLTVMTAIYKGPEIGRWLNFQGNWHAGRDINIHINDNQARTTPLSPQQEKLLRAIYKHQVELGLSRLVILRSGQLFLESTNREDASIDLATEVLGKGNPEVVAREFEMLMEGIPGVYLQKLPETRWGNPFVVAITEAGSAYLNQAR